MTQENKDKITRLVMFLVGLLVATGVVTPEFEDQMPQVITTVLASAAAIIAAIGALKKKAVEVTSKGIGSWVQSAKNFITMK